MLHIRVDIGVIPQGADLVPLTPPVINGVSGTVGTTTMDQQRLHICNISFVKTIYQGWLAGRLPTGQFISYPPFSLSICSMVQQAFA